MTTSPIFNRRSWLIGLGASCATISGLSPAWAGAAVPVSLGELIGLSRFVVVGTARDSVSDWENAPGGRRIVTHTRVEVQQSVDGKSVGQSELTVRTLGGQVGELAQIVHGEAEITRDVPAVYFLRDVSFGGTGAVSSYRVTAMSQGHYPLVLDDAGSYRLTPNPNLAELLRRDPAAAVLRLRDKTVLETERMILDELQRAR